MTSSPDSPQLTIMLYVPDAMLRALDPNQTLCRLIAKGVPELDFVPPPWWEHSHTLRLGPAQADAS